jgi:hypothetical protein
MSRGRQLRTIVKEAVLEGAAVAESIKLGEKRAELKLHKNKPLMESLREHIGKMIDRIDPLETIAVAASTYIIHETIINTATLLGQVNTVLIKPENVLLFDLNPVAAAITTSIGLASMPQPKDIKKPDSILLWVVSFIIAFILVRYAGEIIKGGFDLAKSLPNLLGMLGFVA